MTNSAVDSTAAKKPKSFATLAWALWDWAEQPFPTIFQTFIFANYIISTSFGPEEDTSRALGVAGTIAGVLVALVAPVFGRRSDEWGRRKLWLLINTLTLAGVMASLYFVTPEPGMLWVGLLIFSFGGFVQEIAFINYYAMLRQVSTPNNVGRISGFAWGLGYLGGIILLLISLVGFIQTDTPWFGIGTENAENIRAVFLFSAAWLIVFSIPLFLFVPEVQAKPGVTKENFIESYYKLWSQLKTLARQSPQVFRFLIASAIYRDGLSGVFAYGAVLGTLAFGFELTDVIIFGIAANLVSGIGAVAGGLLEDRIGAKTTIMFSLIGLTLAGVGVFAFASAGPITYWVGGLFLTFFVGPAQASSRSFMTRLTPVGREGEVFGLYQTTGRAVSFISPLLWTTAISIALGVGITNSAATVWGILGLLVVLVAGILLLARVHPNPPVMSSEA